MDLFSLVATLSLNADPYTAGIAAAKGAFSDLAGVVNQGLEMAGKATLNFLKDVVNTGMETDKALGQVYAVSGAFDEYNQTILQTAALQEAANSVFDVADVAMAEYYEGLAGFKPEEIASGLHGIVIAAEAAGEPIKGVSDILTDTVTAFGENASQMTRYADVFAATATSSNTTIMKMGNAMQYVGPVAGSLGYTLEDVATSIGLIADAGIKGSKAGTSLKNIFTRIATNAGVVRNAAGDLIEPGALDIIQSMGVQFYDAAGKARPWNDFLMDMREAWNGLDPKKASMIAQSFSDVDVSAEEAIANVEGFFTDIQEWRSEWNNLSTDTQRQAFAEKLSDQFEALGISMYDSAGRLRNFTDVAHEAEIKLGGLNDQEQQYYGKKIGSLRGIAAWLRLMEATDDEYKEMYDSIMNAEGAADKMRDTMYDNLAGDVVHFQAAFDVLKKAIYEDIKGPMREVVQFGTDAIKEITDAVNEGGIEAGIKKLSEKIEELIPTFKPMLEALGQAVAPILETILTTLLPTVEEVGVSLATGLLNGLSEGLSTSENSIIAGLGSLLGEGGSLLDLVFGNGNGLFGTLFGKQPDDYMHNLLASPDTVSSYLLPPELRNEQPMDLTIDYSMQPGTMESLSAELGNVDTTAFSTAIGTAGETGGTEAATQIATALGGIDISALATAIGNAGTTAGATLVSNIQSALAGGSYSINVSANVTGLPNAASPEKHAKSMYGGTIMRGATMFGYNAAGQPLIGGDAGAEAIIGLQSLDQMIHQSVGDAFDNVSAKPADDSKTLTQAVAGGLQMYGPELAAEIAERVGNIVASAVARIASRPTVVEVGGKAIAQATVDYNAIAANSRNKSYARGYGVGK